jgi:hypothetical protein
MREATAAAEPPLEPPEFVSYPMDCESRPKNDGRSRQNAELRSIGLSENHQSRSLQANYKLAVVLRRKIFQKAGAGGHRHARISRLQILQEEWNAGEWSIRQAPIDGCTGLIIHSPDDGIECGIGPLDALDRSLEQFGRLDRFAPHEGSLRSRVEL